MSFMAPWIFNPFTANFDYYWRETDISGGLDNLLLEDDSNFLLESGTDDVILLE